jgi:two-component system, OmpR family, response regulator QseB
MRVLLVEDEPAIAMPLQRALKAQGLEVRLAQDVESARDALLEVEPDLLILDIRLHEYEDGGFMLANEARAAGFKGSILFLTARDTLQDRVQGLDGGGDDYVVKPFELLEVMARVRALLRRPTEARSSQLALSPSRIFSPEELLDAVWGDAASSVSVVKVTVYRLREKLGADVVRSSKNGYQMGEVS